MTGLVVWSRDGCPLCDELIAELGAFAADRGLAVAVRDVDGDPQMARRYGHRVPVLTLDGEPVCHGHLDLPELERLLRARS